jgi:hypothetical protein
MSVHGAGVFYPGQGNERKHIDYFESKNCRQDVIVKRRFVHGPKVVHLFEEPGDK